MDNTVEVVIKISKKRYETLIELNDRIKNGASIFKLGMYESAIAKGTVLPKGHDDLIERGQVTNYDNLSDVPVVIKADKGEN